MSSLLIFSGGLDSTVLAYSLQKQNKLKLLLTFDYGQKHKKEIEFAQALASKLNVKHILLDISNIGNLLTGSALINKDIAVPQGAYKKNSISDAVVANRNPIMLTIAFGVAASNQCNQVALAVHSGDHNIYPDCEPKFIEDFANMQKSALRGIADIELQAPFSHLSKTDIVKLGSSLSVPFADTWSCYVGDKLHCGNCPTCIERKSAFNDADISDPTQYKK